ncbi:MAG: hypothetical protein ACOYYF_15385 [Chloroflexota bacterium]|nr:hypothetical protein [Chloroflexota bacterium]MBI5705253.1 hypothetical protein [Chloroflexota bacterium]
MSKRIVIFIALLSMSNLMCWFEAYDFEQDNFTKTKPVSSAVAGTYVLTEKSKKFVSEMEDVTESNAQNISITLFSDGTFEMQNMPKNWAIEEFQFNSPNDVTFPIKGKWSLVQENWWWRIEFVIDLSGKNSTEFLSNTFSSQVDIGGEHPPYSLWLYIGVGDPNRLPLIIFEQVVK